MELNGLSFKISYNAHEEEFIVKQFSGDTLEEETNFPSMRDAMHYIEDVMSMSLHCQENWTLSY